MTKNYLKKIYDKKHAQAGDTELNFLEWAIDYLLSKKKAKKSIKSEIKIVDYDYVDGDILCVEIKDDRGKIYKGSLEIAE